MVKGTVRIPVIAVGRLDDPDVALRVIEEGKADMIAIGRGLLADPHWPVKVQRGEVEDILPCLGYHECLYRIIETLRPLGCAVNPLTGREFELRIEKARERRKVVVVGGGVAGMRGHEVVLFEREKELGGLLRILGRMSFKRDMERLRRWYVRQLDKLGISVELGKEASVDEILSDEPDVIIVATGAEPLVPKIPGVDKPHVLTAVEAWKRMSVDGQEAVIVGAGLVGLETALWLAEEGKRVSVVEMRGSPTLNVSRANWMYLLTKLKHLGVRMHFNARVEEIGDASVRVSTPGGTIELGAEAVVIAAGMRPNRKLYDELLKTGKDVRLIGDALAPRRIKEAIREGFHTALSI